MRHLKTGLVLLGVSALALTACGKKVEEAPADGAAATAPAVGEVATASDMPRRKPGLWEQSISADGSAPMVIKICLDEATDKAMSVAGSQASKEACPDNKMTRTADGYSFSATCNMGTGGTVASTGTMKGDFNSAYEVVANSTTTGASVPQMNRASTVKISAKWAGACPEGMSPGDQQMPGGMTINMSQFDPEKAKALAKEAAAAAAAGK